MNFYFDVLFVLALKRLIFDEIKKGGNIQWDL